MAYIGKQPTIGNFVKLDAITTSATATYNLLNGGVAYSPQSANHCIVSLNGVIQSPTTSFTISGSTIVFASALTATDVIDFILVLGDVLNIGTPSDATVTNAKLALTAGSAGTPAISIAADTNTGIFFPAADTIGFAEGGTESMRIDSSGRLLVGITTSRQQGYGDASSLQLEGTSYTNASIGLMLNSNNTDAPSINFGKSRGTVVGSNTVVQNGDNLGLINFGGADGTDSAAGARIICKVDGTPGNNDMPANLIFQTAPDGTASPEERIRIESDGDVLINGTNNDNNSRFRINGSAAVADYSTRHVGTTSGTHTQIINTGIASGGLGASGTFYQMYDGGNLRFQFKGDGNATCDASFTGGGADYAEYFEWLDGNPNNEDRVGFTVVLENGKIKKATETDNELNIMGVISKNPTVVGDAQPNSWVNKFVRDDFGRVQFENLVSYRWEEIKEDGSKEFKGCVPSRDGITPPENAEEYYHDYPIYNESFDKEEIYVPRTDRKEWSAVGMMGKLRIRKNEIKKSNWLKIRDISLTVEEWLVR